MKKIRFVLLLFALCCVGLGSGFFSVSATEQQGFSSEFELVFSCSVGEKIDLPSETYSDGTDIFFCRVSVLKKDIDSTRVEAFFDENEEASFVFDSAGQWLVVYEAVTDDGVVSDSHILMVENKPFIIINEISGFAVFGEEVLVPAAYLINGQDRTECGTAITAPDGTSVASSDSFICSQVGVYVITYSCEENGNRYQKQKRIKSELNYENLFDGKGIKSISSNVEAPNYSVSANGVKICASGDAAVRFKHPIDLSALTSVDNVIEFQILNNGDPDFRFLTITLTDVYDSDKILTVYYRYAGGSKGQEWMYAQSFLSAGVGGFLGGYEGNSLNKAPYGSVMNNSFYGELGYQWNSNTALPLFNFQFDNESGKIFSKTKANKLNQSVEIMNLYDFESTEVVWDGFTTGEVWLDIKFPACATPDIVVTEIAGNKLSGSNIDDKVAPVLCVSTDKIYGRNLPDAKTGEAYPIPKAYALDVITGNVSLFSEVIYVPTGEKVEAPDNKVSPTKNGEYKVVYTASDSFGNKAEKEYFFTARDNIQELNVAFTETPDYYVGTEFSVPKLSVSGGSGEKSLQTVYTFNGLGALPDVDGYFIFNESGILYINVEIKDYLSVKNVILETEIKEPLFPTVRINNVPIAAYYGETISFADFYVAGFSEGNAYKAVYVNGKRLEGDFSYSVSDSDTELNVEYLVRAAGIEKVFHYTVVIYDSLKATDAFITSEGVERKADGDNGFKFSASKDFKLKTPKPVSVNNLSVSFKLACAVGGKAQLKISDCIDGTKTVTLSFSYKDSTTSYMQLNGEDLRYIVSGGLRNPEKTFSVSLKDGYIFVGEVKTVCLQKYENGRKFDNFGGEGVYLEFGIVGVLAQSAIYLYRLANQSFITIGSFFSDSGPSIDYASNMRNRNYSLNESIFISAAYAYDVFTGIETVYVDVTSPSGEKVIESSEIGNAYLILASEYGAYKVRYYAEDGNGNNNEELFIINVIDDVPPVISVIFDNTKKYRVGEKIVIPQAYAVDAVDGERETLVCIIDAHNSYNTLSYGANYVFSKPGEYRLVYLSFDEQLNCGRYEMIITVEER